MQNFKIELRGSAPLLMHNSRLSNPMDPATKALKSATSKRSKTDEDHEVVARLEHAGGLYLDPDVGPYVPGENIERCLVDGARISKLGVKVQRGVFIHTDVNPLGYAGPRDAAGLWEDKRFVHYASVKVGTSRVMRCRAVFQDWAVSAEGTLDESVLNFEELVQIVKNAGAMCGLGDWRPRFGRFTGTVVPL